MIPTNLSGVDGVATVGCRVFFGAAFVRPSLLFFGDGVGELLGVLDVKGKYPGQPKSPGYIFLC
jgi:hypothetical protein